jgi:hypothetical protein
MHMRVSLYSVLAIALGVANIGCRHPTRTDLILGARAHTTPPSSVGRCDFDLSPDRAETVFFVLGMLDEYQNGRTIIEDQDLVEGFYCNEQDQAKLFGRYLTKLTQEQNLPDDVREETFQGCLPTFHSRVIATRINSCYHYTLNAKVLAKGDDGTYRRTAISSLFGTALFQRGSRGFSSNDITERGLSDEVFYRRRALAYLAGVWSRFGRGHDFRFVGGSGKKATLVESLLDGLGCTEISLETTWGYIPGANIVHFKPTAEVEEWLHKAW